MDIRNIEHIRKAALVTQEKLIVEENQAALLSQVEPSLEMVNAPPIIEATVEADFSENTDEWTSLVKSLTDIEREVIALILQEENVASYAAQNGIMLEVLVDGINEKAVDHVGDTILELDGIVIIYDDYKDELNSRL